MSVARTLKASSDFLELNPDLPYKVADLGSAPLGHKEMALSEREMPGLMAVRKKYGPEKTVGRAENYRQPAYDHPDSHADRHLESVGC